MDSDDARNSDGKQAVKLQWRRGRKVRYFAGLDTIARERCMSQLNRMKYRKSVQVYTDVKEDSDSDT